MLSTAPDHPDLEVTKNSGPTRSRKYHRIPGLTPQVCFTAYNTTIQALEMAVKERIFFVKKEGKFSEPPTPLARVFKRLEFIRKHFRKHSISSLCMSHQRYVESSPAQKKIVYQNAMDSLAIKPLHIADSFVSVFVKYEKLMIKPNKYPVPRVISTRRPRFHLEYGCYIRPVEKYIYKIIDKLAGHPCVMKGYNMSQRGIIMSKHWNSFRAPCAISMDASRFDQHVSVAALEWTHSLYRMFYPGDRRFESLLKRLIKNKHFGNVPNGDLRFNKTGGRKSGDVDTSLGNIIIMVCMTIGYLTHLEIPYRICNDGDDIVVIIEKEHESRFTISAVQWYLDFGFTMEVEPTVYELEHISFCQSQPVFDGTDYVMIRDPRVSLAKDAISMKPLNNQKAAQRYYASIGAGGLSLTGGMPIWQAYYSMFVSNANGIKPSADLSNIVYSGKISGMSRVVASIKSCTRYSFYLAFGIAPDEQIAIEEYYGGYRIGEYGSVGPDYVQLPIN